MMHLSRFHLKILCSLEVRKYRTILFYPFCFRYHIRSLGIQMSTYVTLPCVVLTFLLLLLSTDITT